MEASKRIKDLSKMLEQAMDLLDAKERAWLLAQWSKEGL